jgi:hypothetical protein
MQTFVKTDSREELKTRSLDTLQDLAKVKGIKKEGKGWAKCCPPNGNKDNIIDAICAQAAPRRCNHSININAIGRANSGRLASVFSSDIADAVLLAKCNAGDFDDFHDLQKRVFGIGDKKIQDLKEAGFRVEKRQQVAMGDEEPIEDLRAGVKCKTDQVWRSTKYTCKYTLLKKKEVEKNKPEVDHCWEIQVLKYAYSCALHGYRETRSASEALKNIINSELNLNVTTHEVNQAKKGPFMQVVNLYKKRGGYEGGPTLEDMNCVPRQLVDEGHWARIKGAMVESYEAMEQQTDDLRDDAQKLLAKRVIEHVHRMMDQMGIADQ